VAASRCARAVRIESWPPVQSVFGNEVAPDSGVTTAGPTCSRRGLRRRKAAGKCPLHYALKNWTALTRYLEDGDLLIDNNHTERSLRGIAVGRHNWTFVGSDRGGRTMAVLRRLR